MEHAQRGYMNTMAMGRDRDFLVIKTLSLNLALTLGCVNPKIVNPDVTNPDSNSNPNPNNCGY